MTVASGQMPYQFDQPLPVRAPKGAWPGLVTPNVAVSGLTIEQAMFVYAAEIRKWGFDSPTATQFFVYTHPDISPSGFEPKADGSTLEGLAGGLHSLSSVDVIEDLRRAMQTFLFDLYENDSVYEQGNFEEAWLTNVAPESPSGYRRFNRITANSIAVLSPEWLRPALTDVTGGDFITTTDLHWLGGSGVLLDVDVAEVVFNPFPWPRAGRRFVPSTGDSALNFSPIYPLVQTTAGSLPSMVVSRYKSDILEGGEFKNQTNFDALGTSGLVQIDGYALRPETIMELVRGNDKNFMGTLTGSNDYTGHIQGVRAVNLDQGANDFHARCYRTPTPQASGLYRFITYTPKSAVPQGAIASGYVSIWPEGVATTLENTGEPYTTETMIHGQEITVTSDGGLARDARESTGLHVMDDAIWITSANVGSTGSGNFNSRGLFIHSPHNGESVWYRPAERIVSTSGNVGPGPAIFGAHLGLVDDGTDWVRVARTCAQYVSTNTGNPTPNSDDVITTFHFQSYDKTTLDHTGETSVTFLLRGEDATNGTLSSTSVDGGMIKDGTDIYVYNSRGKVFKFDSSFNFVNAYGGAIAGRRHAANGQLLYTITDAIQTGDPLLSISPPGQSSGIGVWDTTDPTGSATDVVGLVNRVSAKPFRGETHIGFALDAIWHTIFDVSGGTHVADGVWGLLQVADSFTGTNRRLYLVRMTEETTHWQCQESIRLETTVDTKPVADIPPDFPYEAALHDID
jgi:hypothetical protein